MLMALKQLYRFRLVLSLSCSLSAAQLTDHVSIPNLFQYKVKQFI